MTDALVGGLLQALAEPALLVTADGAVVAANVAAAALLGAPLATIGGTRLADHAADDPELISRYLAACARTRSPIPGAIHPLPPTRAGARPDSSIREGSPSGSAGTSTRLAEAPSTTSALPARRRVKGAVVRPARPGAPAIILLRFRLAEVASDRFALLNHQLGELTREVRARRRAEAALLDANAQLHEQALTLGSMNRQLQDQTMELEQQVEEAQRLAGELAEANEALATAAAAADNARAVAESANRAKSEFLAMMSHELRTPLNAIGGYVELLELGIRGPITDAQRDDLERIQRAQRHLLVLISEVLNFARLEAGQVRYSYALVPVDSMLRGLEPLIAPQLQSQGLRYRYESVDRSVTVWADREKLEQILINLLSNAVKFTPPGGEVSLACEADDNRVTIEVRDTGVGINPDKLHRIFEPFVQLDQSLTRSRDGVGLGLAISRDLARGMGGELSARSTPGAGSTFTLTLPTMA